MIELSVLSFCLYDNRDNFWQHLLSALLFSLWRQLGQHFDNFQLSFCAAGVWNTPRCLCCRHIKRKIVRLGVVSCCLSCRKNKIVLFLICWDLFVFRDVKRKFDNYPLWRKDKAHNSTLKSYNYRSNIIHINSYIVHTIKNQ